MAGLAARSPSAITVRLAPSRTAGVAPLAVFFDASGTTADGIARPFHDLHYAWDFGDPAAGVWSTSGLSRNAETGPLSAHVFDSPGTYTVTLTVRDATGAKATRSVQVTVQDPDAVFGGANTICVSQTGNFSGAPAGARTVTTGSFGEAIGNAAPGRRVLLRRGETWSVGGGVRINCAGPGTIGAFGDGALPRLVSPTGTVFRLSDGENPLLQDWRIMDLDVQGAGAGTCVAGGSGTVRQVLLYRLRARDIHTGFSFSPSVLDYFGIPMHDQLAIADCDIAHATGGSGGNLTYIGADRVTMLGNRLWDSRDAEHVLRSPYMNRGVISHNDLRHQARTKHVIKLHAPAWGAGGVYTEKVVLADNVIVGDADWSVGLGPQNDTRDERLRDIIVERNFFTSEALGVQVMLCVWASDVTVRNNIFDVSLASTCISVTPRGIEPPPARVHVYNNTGYSASPSLVLRFVRIASSASATVVRNNLAAAPNQTSAVLLGGTGTGLVESNNLLTRSPGFVTQAPVAPPDFRLATGSPAINAGAAAPVFDDFGGGARPLDGGGAGGWDIGAWEYGTTARVLDTRAGRRVPALHASARSMVLLGQGARPGLSVYRLDGSRAHASPAQGWYTTEQAGNSGTSR